MNNYEVYMSFLGFFRTPLKESRLQCWQYDEEGKGFYGIPRIPVGWKYSEEQTSRFAQLAGEGIIITVYAHTGKNYYLLVSEFGNTVEAAFVYPPKQRHKDTCCSNQPHGSYLRAW